MEDYILELKGITKTFPGVKALDAVKFNLKAGEIHALVGENGAGKSTFIKIISGVYQPDEGEIFLNGERVSFKNPREARMMGIATIYQNIICFPDMSITDNIFLGHEYINNYGIKRLLWKKMHDKAKELLHLVGNDIDPEEKMGNLSIACQQMVEIAKALSQEAKIFIMDEPTAALTQHETEELFNIVKKLKEDGASIIFVSHRIEDIYKIADRITVFRDGNYIGTWEKSQLSRDDLIKFMAGREITQLFPKKKINAGRELLRIKGLSKKGVFTDISFSLHEGEILGVTGLIGSGRSELAQAIFGIHPVDAGMIYIQGKPVRIDNPVKAMKLGIGYLPEDRQKQGLVLPFSIMENITLPVIESLSQRGWLRQSNEYMKAKEMAELLQIKANSVLDKVYFLSGGNQQKVVIAKLLAAKLRILILDEPTKGIDVGAKAAMHEIMCNLASKGYGIIMISSEMPEILGMSDRILVMHKGRIIAEFNRDEVTREKIIEVTINKRDFNQGTL
ncbi:MAG: sugar ABC transporter ATP-binding protein [Tepidanaerobacteraceae bacterium]|jgi:rhamnose transport system ATP-binding protein|nr:sugar ABC transporter ATP-binding protein [Tepidanaerobacteraceae bacterium]